VVGGGGEVVGEEAGHQEQGEGMGGAGGPLGGRKAGRAGCPSWAGNGGKGGGGETGRQSDLEMRACDKPKQRVSRMQDPGRGTRAKIGGNGKRSSEIRPRKAARREAAGESLITGRSPSPCGCSPEIIGQKYHRCGRAGQSLHRNLSAAMRTPRGRPPGADLVRSKLGKAGTIAKARPRDWGRG